MSSLFNEMMEEIDEKDKKIADLEAKLAESEKLNETLQQVINKLRDAKYAGKTLVEAVNAVYEPIYKNKCDEVDQLKQQLAEKDEQIKKLKTDLKDWQDLEEKLGTKYDKVVEQLAEKDQAIESLQEINQSLGHTCNNDAKEIERLNKLLTEKEKQVNTYAKEIAFLDKRVKNLNHEAQKYYEDAYCNGIQNQTAIAELEKAKDKTDALMFKINNMNYFIMAKEELYDFIDQQIKSLKGEK